MLKHELWQAKKLRQEKKREPCGWIQAAMQARSTAAKAEQHVDPGLKLAPVTVHHPSTGYAMVFLNLSGVYYFGVANHKR